MQYKKLYKKLREDDMNPDKNVNNLEPYQLYHLISYHAPNVYNQIQSIELHSYKYLLFTNQK